ncbi:MAG: hypothetical protein H6Q04_940, partial [Acidobacteria bacterium]|nr:hypothetical protein [Acidobacteriota bacterium]
MERNMKFFRIALSAALTLLFVTCLLAQQKKVRVICT